MNVKETGFPGLKIINPKVFEDARGYFFESFNQQKMKSAGMDAIFIQDNQSKSQYGVIRGLHYQKNPHAQTKLVQVVQGAIFDVAVDLRKNSPTFGKWFGLELSEFNRLQLFIPRGFAHGFSVLSETALVFYKCDAFYNPASEQGIIYNDSYLNISWQIPADKEIISPKDINLHDFKSADYNFSLNTASLNAITETV